MMGIGRKALWCCLLMILLLHVFTSSAQGEDHEDIVVTKRGLVRGTRLSSPSGSLTAFLGIPFGEPPVGALRFKKSLPAKPWKGILNATQFGNSCFQAIYNMTMYNTSFEIEGVDRWSPKPEQLSEDCLYLNVWVPSGKLANATVMVFFYGGGFIAGATSLPFYDPWILAQTENIIVVSMNYRVGPLGFLAFPGNSQAPGNAGLFDQQLALRWVQENIAAFGGDPGSVTLFGMSAGAASVGYQTLSISSQSLFKRGIYESGSFNAPYAFLTQQESRKRALKLGALLGCSHPNESEVIACLLTKSPKEITDHQFSVVPPNTFTIAYFAPTVDGEFLTDTPNVLLKQRKYKQADILAGVTKDEGSLFLLFGGGHFTKDKNMLLTRMQLKEALKFFFPTAGEQELESILFQYTDPEDQENPEKNRNALNHALGDYNFVCPITALTKQIVEHGNNVFVYMFDHQTVHSYFPDWMGVVHCAEREYLFGEPLNGTNTHTKTEQDLSKRIMRYWANFARTGTPTEAGADERDWLKFTNTDPNYATLNTEPLQIKQNMHRQQCEFWDSYYPKE